jgi:hypothetical protein
MSRTRGSIHPLLTYGYMAYCLVKHRNKFIFTPFSPSKFWNETGPQVAFLCTYNSSISFCRVFDKYDRKTFKQFRQFDSRAAHTVTFTFLFRAMSAQPSHHFALTRLVAMLALCRNVVWTSSSSINSYVRWIHSGTIMAHGMPQSCLR